MRMLVEHAWPGNIRELQNYVERGVILSNNGIFDPPPPERCGQEPPEIANPTLEDKVRHEILAACQRANWKLGGPRGAAARLGLKRTTLFYKMKRFGIASPPPTFCVTSRRSDMAERGQGRISRCCAGLLFSRQRKAARVAAEAVNATIDHSDIRGSKPHAHDPSGAASH